MPSAIGAGLILGGPKRRAHWKRAMWWDGQNLDKPLVGPDGTRWFFRVWHGTVDGVHCQRLFFWDESRSETGLVELRGGEALHVSRIKKRLAKIAKDAEWRRRFARPTPSRLRCFSSHAHTS